MNLPELGQLRNDESTYIAFTKGLLDLDYAISNKTPYYFSKVVALNLPVWKNPDFFIDLDSVGEVSTNPNIVIPKTIQYYMENIIRQVIIEEGNDGLIEEIVELAFYKMLNKMGLSRDQINETITFTNDIVTSNFINTESNNGWGEIICQIPNRCRTFNLVNRTVENVKSIVATDDDDTALYDNGYNQILFDDDFKSVIDFNNSTFDDVTEASFDFNCLLLFYRDQSGIHKLHGINFIYPFENKVTYWDQQTFTQKTNVTRNIGYQFIFNLKTCNNEASLVEIYNQNEHAMWWNGFEKTLSGLNSFLENKMRENGYERGGIDYVKLSD